MTSPFSRRERQLPKPPVDLDAKVPLTADMLSEWVAETKPRTDSAISEDVSVAEYNRRAGHLSEEQLIGVGIEAQLAARKHSERQAEAARRAVDRMATAVGRRT